MTTLEKEIEELGEQIDEVEDQSSVLLSDLADLSETQSQHLLKGFSKVELCLGEMKKSSRSGRD